MNVRRTLLGLGLVVVVGAGIYGLTLPDPPPDPPSIFEPLPPDHPLRMLEGVYEVDEARAGPCEAMKAVSLPQTASHFGFRTILGTTVGKPCATVEDCTAMIDPRRSFRYTPTPRGPAFGSTEVDVDLETLLGISIDVSEVNGDEYTGGGASQITSPGPDGQPRCVRTVAQSTVRRVQGGLDVARRWYVSEPVAESECEQPPMRCVQGMDLVLREVGD